MSLQTRGSAALDKAQRRLALLKSIDQHLDFGNGLTIEAYSRLINATRAMLEAHNTLLSKLDESRKTLNQMDEALSEMSERMLYGVATIYGKNSIEYSKAGGSNRKRSKKSISLIQVPSDVELLATQTIQNPIVNKLIDGNGSLSDGSISHSDQV